MRIGCEDLGEEYFKWRGFKVEKLEVEEGVGMIKEFKEVFCRWVRRVEGE